MKEVEWQGRALSSLEQCMHALRQLRENVAPLVNGMLYAQKTRHFVKDDHFAQGMR